ncbi:hypothetical protein [Gluconobacter japonicus]|uniref:hypothetical protein n=1 Tax=Gluconobacter japonicus TaxID=376620 RepID=UPI0007859350|nr:hypothetical protein [Gluconobacter japonicus]KXV23323.1 hypothetical protein AD935_00635 [Gluconobacter japonicus]
MPTLLHEDRKLNLAVNDHAIDAWFERITQRLTEEKTTNLKGLLASNNKLSAIRYKPYQDVINLFENTIVTTPPDMRRQPWKEFC